MYMVWAKCFVTHVPRNVKPIVANKIGQELVELHFFNTILNLESHVKQTRILDLKFIRLPQLGQGGLVFE